MNYQISRNGQLYGPYTLEDLQRYVASGNVLPMDLAKTETMTEWLPVSQILANAAAATPAQTATIPAGSGYAPVGQSEGYPGLDYRGAAPSFGAGPSNASIAASSYPDAPNLHWALVLLFTVLTCGLFITIWNFIISGWLRRVQPNANAIFFYAGAYLLPLVGGGLAIPLGLHAALRSANGDAIGSSIGTTGLFGILGIAVWVLRLVARYSERSSLEEHYNGPEPVGLQLDAVMTFFFGGLYFQAKLNEINGRKRVARLGY